MRCGSDGAGDYKTTEATAPPGHDDTPAAVLISTPNLHLRGMDRNTVIVDGTEPASPVCSSADGEQNFGSGDGTRSGGTAATAAARSVAGDSTAPT